jgi:hypothetical protein
MRRIPQPLLADQQAAELEKLCRDLHARAQPRKD